MLAGTSCVSGRGDGLCVSVCDSGPAVWRSACSSEGLHGEGATALHGHLQGQDGYLRGSTLLVLNRGFHLVSDPFVIASFYYLCLLLSLSFCCTVEVQSLKQIPRKPGNKTQSDSDSD